MHFCRVIGSGINGLWKSKPLCLILPNFVEILIGIVGHIWRFILGYFMTNLLENILALSYNSVLLTYIPFPLLKHPESHKNFDSNPDWETSCGSWNAIGTVVENLHLPNEWMDQIKWNDFLNKIFCRIYGSHV